MNGLKSETTPDRILVTLQVPAELLPRGDYSTRLLGKGGRRAHGAEPLLRPNRARLSAIRQRFPRLPHSPSTQLSVERRKRLPTGCHL